MRALFRRLFGRSGVSRYVRRPPLILVNGLAEQAESWFRNVDVWRRHFDVHTPGLLAYEGDSLHRHIRQGRQIDVDYLVEKLHRYLDDFVQSGPCHLVANSLGGKIAVEFAARHPESVRRLVLLCPSGLSDKERLPVIEGMRRKDVRSLVDSVFCNPRRAESQLLDYYQCKFASRRWKSGLLRTIQGTKNHRVREQLCRVSQPTLLVVGQEDRIVDPQQAIDAARLLPHGKLVVLPHCGHAPQIEQADVINRLVVEFLAESESR